MLDPGLQFSSMMNSPDAHLAVYLNDHLAGAAAALEILDSFQHSENPGLEKFATSLRAAILEDRDELTRLMAAAGIAASPVRRAFGWVAEKTAELKLKVDDPADSGLRTFELLEIVALGIDGKRALWAVLRSIAEVVPALRSADYSLLARRADDQRATVEARRLEWASGAFTAKGANDQVE